MPASVSRGCAWLMPALIRASSVRTFKASVPPSIPRAATRILIELLPISMTATDGMVTTKYTKRTKGKTAEVFVSFVCFVVSQFEILRRDQEAEFPFEECF